MSQDNPHPPTAGSGPRRGSITQAAMSNLFQRNPNGPPFPGVVPGSVHDNQRRRLSITTVGLSASSPTNPATFGMRRGSLSTNSDSLDESAIEDEDATAGGSKMASGTSFARRMSIGASAMRGFRPAGSPGNGNDPSSPPTSLGRRPSAHGPWQPQASPITTALSAAGRRASVAMPSVHVPKASSTKHPRVSSDSFHSRADQQGFNWPEQLRSRAESSVSGARPSFSLASSPPAGRLPHDRAKSVSDMPPPPAEVPPMKPKPASKKPDAFQERILKGDFYMD